MPDPRAVIASIPALSGARPVRKLGGSQASDSWLLERSDGPVMLRIDRPLAARLGLDRASEFGVLRTAFAAGLGPEPLHSDPAAGVLVTRFLPGAQWRPEDLRQPARLGRLGRLLRRVHGLPLAGRRFEPVRIAEHYARHSGVADAGRMVEQVAALAGQLFPAGAPGRLCHGDPNAANIIGPVHPRLIDWEYSAIGEPLFDLAVVCRFHALDAIRGRVLLEAWSGRPATEHRERLEGWMRLYDLLTGLWQDVVSGSA